MEKIMGKTKWLIAAASFAVIATIAPARAGDAALGANVFKICKACHEISTPKKKIGPSLQGVFERKAGTLADFPYSDAMKNSGIVWNADTLKAYLADPKGNIPGNKMAFVGVKKPDDLENLLAYMAEASK
jgi:cytochrome c2